MDTSEEELKILDNIKKSLVPLNEVKFKDAIKAISGKNVIPFDKNEPKDRELLEYLSQAADLATKAAYRKGIHSRRVNEVGNKIEPFAIEALKKVGLVADRPKTSEAKRKSAGYPDIFVKDKYGRPSYIECKTYNQRNFQTTQRSFYFSPSERPTDFKVIYDARHIVISFKIEKEQRNGKDVYVPVQWKIFTLDGLSGRIKHEFNASNRKMYKKDALLAQSR